MKSTRTSIDTWSVLGGLMSWDSLPSGAGIAGVSDGSVEDEVMVDEGRKAQRHRASQGLKVQ